MHLCKKVSQPESKRAVLAEKCSILSRAVKIMQANDEL
jgi:hypothetical protein